MEQELFTAQDLEELQRRGISLEEATQQVEDIRQGFPYLEILASASLEDGIISNEPSQEERYMSVWERYLERQDASVYKMVPASGAASRMFKMLFSFLDADYSEPRTEAERRFFDELHHFAFYELLNEACLRNHWKSIPKLLAQGDYKAIVETLLLPKGLGYGSKPKGLLLFHRYDKVERTALEEHFVEGALYARDSLGQVHLHFTISPEHQRDFESLVARVKDCYEEHYSVRYLVSFSQQEPATDTLALTPEGGLFRREDGSLLFRPGGHGSLIRNLNALDADIVFIKNIDNVVLDLYKGPTVMYKKYLGGVLVAIRDQVFGYLRQLDKGKVSHSQLEEMSAFMRDTFGIRLPEVLDDESLAPWLREKLNRPIRVCGMVRNEGEPGGGPFVIRETDGSSSLQILESSQINMADEGQRQFFEAGQYFNPVDLVCSLRDWQGKPFDLERYVNPKTAFIAHKSQAGRELLALERPGLWNGAMHDWNTAFVEVPLETFNPVKEVNDLLRPEHQA